MFGHKSDIISSGVMDYTYGISVWDQYNEEIHPVERKVYRDEEWIVEHIFQIFVRANEEVQVDSKVTHFPAPRRENTYIPIHRTKDRDPAFTTDPGCEQLGQIEIYRDTDIPLNEQKTKTTFIFGDTELHVLCENVKTGKAESLTLDLSK
ncbi:hypothetical protein DPMN_136474 [Dreissena polymorpha]|uniref:Uncharacterized protein n=1 Tax=Dreissena polymorpha TaxID=45954 RepID=A0A9D4G3P1_DREPO|nr:hypothetical protein DPMN_136474 [Dreissena polymorpha]